MHYLLFLIYHISIVVYHFDSLTNLLTYNKAETVSRFISSLASTIKKSETKGVFYALDVAEHESMIQKCGLYVDKVITIK